MLGLVVINYTSGLALKLLGIFRNNLPVLVSIIFLKESISAVELTGYVISIFGFIAYAYLQTKTPYTVAGSEPTSIEPVEMEEGVLAE